MLDLSSFNNMQLDAIREVGNIGTGMFSMPKYSVIAKWRS